MWKMATTSMSVFWKLVCPCWFMAIQLYWNFKLWFYFSPQNLGIQIEGAAYLQMLLIHRNFFSFRAITLKPKKNRCTRRGNINPPQHCCTKFHQGHNQKTIKKQERERIKCTFTNDKCASNVEITTELWTSYFWSMM